jgi:anti-anti-sigma regulatory factor
MEGSDIQVTVTRSTTKVVVIALEGPVDGTTDDAANTQLSKAVAALPPPDLVVIDLSIVNLDSIPKYPTLAIALVD